MNRPLPHLVSLIGLLAALATSIPAEESFVKPKAIRPGDTIALVAPAYPLRAEKVDLVETRLIALGFKVKKSPNLLTRYGYLAGSDEERAQALMDAFRDPEVKAIFPGTGGYGVSRILDRLDYDVIRANPKMLIGFSDITGLHLAIAKKCNLITFHSPNPLWGLGNEEGMDPFAESLFWRAIRADSYFGSDGKRLDPGWVYSMDGATTQPKTLVPGVGRGRLIGGNLSLIAALMGTPYEIETENRILFLEDVGEAPYRVDRMLAQLEMAGKLDSLAGAILGQWSKCVADEPENSLTLDQIFDRYFGRRPYPVVKDFPVGHVRQNATLPEGVEAELDAATCRLRLLEDPVEAEPPGRKR